MKVKDLAWLIEGFPPEALVFIRLDGTILDTDSIHEHHDYNSDPEAGYYILGLKNE